MDTNHKQEIPNDKQETSDHKQEPSDHKQETSEKNQGNTDEKSTTFSSIVAAHYNSIETCLNKRSISRIYHLRNFNNWLKTTLIKEAVMRISHERPEGINVLDMCCGKGGDLLKWVKSNVNVLILADIADISLKECESRMNDIKKKNSSCWKGYFILADCTKERLKEKYPPIELDIVSCQFSFHYCFESLPQAECMLRNASDCLRSGGLFIGTMPNANEIVKRLKQSKKNCISNSIFSLQMCCAEPYPLFGAKYDFHLADVVNCPEFLVHFPTFEKLAWKYGLKLVEKESFSNFFHKKKASDRGRYLMRKMKALEMYSANSELVGPIEEYSYAKAFCESRNLNEVGTLSKSEWEVISLYQTFVFEKV